MKLKQLKVNAFRGATKPLTIDFDSQKNITMIFGENGNGKSTISDAIDCLCNNSFGSLQDKSSVDKNFIRSLDTSKSDLSIQLVTDEGIYKATHSSTGNAFVKNPSSGLPIVKSLRRNLIVGLIDSQPSQRYDSLKGYIEIDNIYKCEEELRKTKRNFESDFQSYIRSLADARATLESIWKDEGSPGQNYLGWAGKESKKDLTKENETHAKLRGVVDAWDEIKRKETSIDQVFKEIEKLFQARVQAERELQKLEQESGSNGAKLLSLLKEAQAYISKEVSLTQCPVCSNPIERTKIVESLTAQIDSMREIEQKTKSLAIAKKSEEDTKAINRRKLFEFKRDVMACKALALDGTDWDFSSIKHSFDEFLNEVNEYVIFESFGKQKEFIDPVIEEIRSKADIIKQSIDKFNAIKRNYLSVVSYQEKVTKMKKLLDLATQSLDTVETSRKTFIDNELLSISENVEELFSKMHPEESIGGIKLFMKAGVKNSINLTANFFNACDITPQSIYSESHLDTLGIAIFIALAIKYSDGNAILVLDDVVMSVDENHLDRFISMLHDVADNFAHIIITTHYRPWSDRYKNNRAPASRIQLIELSKWSKERGIKVQNGKIAINELELLLSEEVDFERANISSLSGRILENVLDYLTVKYSCRLPRKPKNDYQLKELLDGLSSKLLKVMNVQSMTKNEDGKYSHEVNSETELKLLIDRLKQLTAVRNQVGAHFNFDGSLVSDADVKEFGNLTFEFAKLLICPEDGSLPDRDKSGSYLETRSGSIRLYPLREPVN
ncbi:hypothetical protein BA6E_1255 [Bacteroidales bacterium 6E]|nr:hypothetical protein BA6E_1255 [Bacteroidales bacterium 6E]